MTSRDPLSLWTRSRLKSPSYYYVHPLYSLQICFLMAVNVIGQRMNFMVILHGCWLVAILTRRRREAIARLWPNYCLFLTLFLLYQYLLCLGMPPALCIGKPRVGGGGHVVAWRVVGCFLATLLDFAHVPSWPHLDSCQGHQLHSL